MNREYTLACLIRCLFCVHRKIGSIRRFFCLPLKSLCLRGGSLFAEQDSPMPHGWHIRHLYIVHSIPLLGEKQVSCPVGKYPALCFRDLRQNIRLPSGRIVNGIGILRILQRLLPVIRDDFLPDLPNCLIIPAGILIHLMDRGAGDDIMELVGQDQFPSLCQLLLLCPGQVLFPHGRHGGEPFRLPVEQLHFPVHALVIALAGVCTSVVFQVQLPVPGMDILLRIPHVHF